MRAWFRLPLWFLVIFSASTAVARQGKEPPSILRLSAPREVVAGQDAAFEATLPPGIGGTVRFALKRYTRQTVWKTTAPAASGRAAVTLPAAEAIRPTSVQGVTFAEHKFVRDDEGPQELENGAKHWFDRGAAGVFFFNREPWTTLGRIGFDDELALRTRVDDVYGYREGPVIAFTSWYPPIQARERQREALKPLCLATDSSCRLDGSLFGTLRFE